MSQEWIADAVSLTAVHVNRVLKELELNGMIRRTMRSRRTIEILDWDQLADVGDFNPAYLHLDQAQPAAL